jgi:hypothetical protein
MGWKAYQIAIFFGVMCWQISILPSDNRLAQGVIAFAAADLGTVFLSWLLSLIRKGWQRGWRYRTPF